MLDVVDTREPNKEKAEKVCFICWKRFTCKDLEKISKIVPSNVSQQCPRKLRRDSKAYEWKDTHFILSKRTSPDVMRSSPKYSTSIPSSSLRLKSIPELFNKSMESGANMSSLLE